jgi:hypothetical protein
VAEWKAENYDDDEACEAKPTALYRHFDGEGRLLYVGISLSAIIRLATHRASPWFDEIASVEIERYQTRKDALTAELAAIHNEKPLHNVVGVVRDNIGTTTAARLGAIRRDRMQQECNEKVQAVEVVE